MFSKKKNLELSAFLMLILSSLDEPPNYIFNILYQNNNEVLLFKKKCEIFHLPVHSPDTLAGVGPGQSQDHGAVFWVSYLSVWCLALGLSSTASPYNTWGFGLEVE